MIVVDTSAIVAALLGRPPMPALSDRLVTGADLHAPHLIDVEFIHALGRLVRVGHLNPDRAEDARLDFAELVVTRYPHAPLADRMWALRHNVSAYGAAYLALAEALDAPLVTCDARMARSSGHDAQIEVYIL